MPSSDLSVFFRPHGVAVIGASRDPQKLGHGVVRNLINNRYPGPIYPVNPRDDVILDHKVYPTIGDVPDPVDLAVIAVPAPIVSAQVEACGQRGVKGVIIISGGFREIGPEGLAREEAVKRIAHQYGIRVIGPNCIGTIDAHTPLNTTFVVGMPRPGEIAFLSQSGAMAAAVMDWALGAGVGFSRIVSLGNQVDVGASDMIEAIGRDGHTRVVTAYLEGIRNGRKFVEAASQAAKDFPIAVLKAGRSTSAARAAASHTGALAGDVEAYRAAFRRAGVLWAETTEELFDWGRALAWQPLPKGNRVAILTNAGGPAILAVDALVEAGMQLAPLSASTKSFLRQRVLPAASVENPVDILAGSGPATYALCLDALLTDETVDAVVVMQAPQDWFDPISVAEVVGEVANSALGRQKPIIAVLMGLASTSEATQALHRRRIPNFAFAERVGSTLAAMWWRKQWLDAQAQPQRPARFTKVDRDTAKAAIRAGLEVNRIVIGKQVGSERSGWMTAEQVTALLNAYKIETPASGLAPNVEQAIPLAESVGYPVALKLAATDVTHKTDLGGVVLDVETPDELREAFEAMIARVVERAPKANIQGAFVQHMVKGQVELIVGVVRDPQFGPLVMAGSGGTHVELTRDVTFELAPLSARQADEMLDRTAAGKLLGGYRGAPPADRKAVVDVILRLAQIAVDWPEISEIEINPLIVMAKGGGASAVDARVRLAYIPDDEDGSAAG